MSYRQEIVLDTFYWRALYNKCSDQKIDVIYLAKTTRTIGDRKPPPRQLIQQNSYKPLSRSGKNSVEKFLDPDRDPDQHQNRMVCCQCDILTIRKFQNQNRRQLSELSADFVRLIIFCSG